MNARHGRSNVVAMLVAMLTVASVDVGAQMRAGLWLDVFVQADDGTPVTDLSRGDFVVQQGGVIGRILDAELIEWPLRVVILLEESIRVAGYLAHLRNGLPQLVDGLPEGSEVAVVLFASRPRTLVETTTDLGAVREAFDQYFARRGANVNMFQAFRETVDRLYSDYAEGPVIATITGDASTNVARRRVERVAEQVTETGTTVHALVLNTQAVTRQAGIARGFSEMTGGWVEEVSSPSVAVVRRLTELGQVIAERAAARPARYLVTFQPPAEADDQAAEITIAVRRPQVRVQVRGQSDSRER
jgi:hypothetical protein